MPVSHTSALLDVRGLRKSFAVPVLKNLDFSLFNGEIHALMGSNGAGKSTLCNIIAGILQADAGTMTLAGKPHKPGTIREAERAGVRMVMQELNLFPTLSVAENLCFGRFRTGLGVINRRDVAQRARRILARVGLEDLDPATPVASLGVGQRQLLEIARALDGSPKLLILDEPTAALTDPQIHRLFTELKALRDAGAGIIYISHRMDEITRIADRVSVLRDGELVATGSAAELDRDQLVELMAGTPLLRTSRRENLQRGKALLRAESLGRHGAFRDISFTLHAGEVIGIAGLIGAGRTELLRALFGADRADSGALRLASDSFNKNQRFARPSEAISAGIGLVVEDRKDQGLLLPRSISDNISLAVLHRLHDRLGLIDTDAEESLALSQSAALDIRCNGPQQPVAQLSGGNQQKVLIARWLARDLPILLFDEPGRGVDAAAKARIHALIREAAAAGKGVIVVSSENEELLGVADRVLVLSRGRLAGEFPASTVNEAELLSACFRYHLSGDALHAETP